MPVTSLVNRTTLSLSRYQAFSLCTTELVGNNIEMKWLASSHLMPLSSIPIKTTSIPPRHQSRFHLLPIIYHLHLRAFFTQTNLIIIPLEPPTAHAVSPLNFATINSHSHHPSQYSVPIDTHSRHRINIYRSKVSHYHTLTPHRRAQSGGGAGSVAQPPEYSGGGRRVLRVSSPGQPQGVQGRLETQREYKPEKCFVMFCNPH